MPSITVNFPTIDWAHLIPDLVGLLFQAVGQLAYNALRNMLLTLWSGLFFSLPHNLIDQFGPAEQMQRSLLVVFGSSVTLALALLGLRAHHRGVTGHLGSVWDEALGRIIVIVAAFGALPWLIYNGLQVEQEMAGAVMKAGLGDILRETNGPSDVEDLIALVVAAVLGVRLWFKLSSNVVRVAVAFAWSPAALGFGLIPESSWICSLWVREFVGRLIGAVLAAIAVGIGFGIAMLQGGLIVISLVGGAFIAAADLVDWLARSPNTSIGGVTGAAIALGSRAAGMTGAAVGAGFKVAPGETTHMSDADVARFYGLGGYHSH